MPKRFDRFVALILVGPLSLPAQYAVSQGYPGYQPRQDPGAPVSPGYPGWQPHQDSGYAAAAAPAIPLTLLQCEGDQCTSPRGGGGAVWVFQGPRGQAMWHYGAIASLTVRAFDGRTIVIHREDPNPSYSSPRFADPTKRSDGVFFADYVGTIHGDRVDGVVTWNGGGQGTWYATIAQSFCGPTAKCPLDVSQLIQLGQNSLKARLNYSALRCFWAAAAAGDSDGQAFAGIMTRDGIGTPANPPQGVRLLEASANQGNYSGALALSQSYEMGLGVPKDPAQAQYWKEKAVRRAEELRQQTARQEQQQQQQQIGELVLGVVVIGAIAALLSSGSGDSDSGPSSDSGSSSRGSSYDAMRRSEALSRRAEWYSHGGAFGGPDPLWQKGDPVPK